MTARSGYVQRIANEDVMYSFFPSFFAFFLFIKKYMLHFQTNVSRSGHSWKPVCIPSSSLNYATATGWFSAFMLAGWNDVPRWVKNDHGPGSFLSAPFSFGRDGDNALNQSSERVVMTEWRTCRLQVLIKDCHISWQITGRTVTKSACPSNK